MEPTSKISWDDLLSMESFRDISFSWRALLLSRKKKKRASYRQGQEKKKRKKVDGEAWEQIQNVCYIMHVVPSRGVKVYGFRDFGIFFQRQIQAVRVRVTFAYLRFWVFVFAWTTNQPTNQPPWSFVHLFICSFFGVKLLRGSKTLKKTSPKKKWSKHIIFDTIFPSIIEGGVGPFSRYKNRPGGALNPNKISWQKYAYHLGRGSRNMLYIQVYTQDIVFGPFKARCALKWVPIMVALVTVHLMCLINDLERGRRLCCIKIDTQRGRSWLPPDRYKE